MEKVQKIRKGWDEHGEVKLVHVVMQEVGSRNELGEAYWKETSVILRQEVGLNEQMW